MDIEISGDTCRVHEAKKQKTHTRKKEFHVQKKEENGRASS